MGHRSAGATRARRLTPEELAEARLDPTILRRAWRIAAPYHRLVAVYVVVIVASSLVAILPPLVFKRLIDVALPARDLGMVNLLVAAAVGLALAETLLRLLNRWFAARIGEGLVFDLRVRLYDQLQRMPLAFYTRTQTGALLSRMSTDVVGAQGTVGTLATVTSDVFLLTATIGAMLLLSWQVTLFALLIVPLVVVLDRRVSPRMVVLSRQRMDLTAEMGSTMTERFNVAGALLVKLFGHREREVDAFAGRAGALRDAAVRLAMTTRLYYATLTLMGALGTAGVYWVGSRAVIDGSLEIGGLVALAAYVARLYSPLTNLASARVDLLTALVSFDRCFEVLDAPRLVDDAADAVHLARPEGRIELDDVWFRYPSAAQVSLPSLEGGAARRTSSPSPEPDDGEGGFVLHGVSATIEPGSLVALVGPSGAGKSTLSSLVPRLYDVTSGAVRIDGRDVRSVTQASLRDAIGVVSQDPHLFHDTVANNLRFARPEASDDEVEAAARAAHVDHVVRDLPEGYDTMVGERGYRLSGGEKQRLAIARMLLKDPAVVILDEATSHLDAESEELVQQALAVALAGRTAIVIAHRLSTIRSADEILVLDRGHIVQRGTHAELLAGRGRYADLYQTLLDEAV